MRKQLTLFFIAFAFFLSFSPASAAEKINAYLFYGEGCPHCAKEKELFNNIIDKYPLEVKEFEIYHHPENAYLLEKVAGELNANAGGVPFLVIGDKYFIGYAEGATSEEILKKLEECTKNSCPDRIGSIIALEKSSENQKPAEKKAEPKETQSKEKIIKIPFWGEVDIYKFSLPVLTIVIGMLDGFNPCAMWILLFLISLLLRIEDKKRRWILGSAFIVTSSAVYFIFMAAWLNLILFLGFIVWIRLLIGLVAIFGGGYNLKEFIFDKKSGCKVTKEEKRKKIFQKLKAIIEQKSFWLALGGIIILAFLVNLVELLCSAGLPAIYTQVLALNNLATWQYYLYILVYIFFFMLDDLFVFFIAMATLEMTGVTTKYTRYSKLIGGIIMLIIGLLFLFKPEWLMFG